MSDWYICVDKRDLQFPTPNENLIEKYVLYMSLEQKWTSDGGIWHKMGGEVETAVQQVTQSQDTLVTALLAVLSLSLLPSHHYSSDTITIFHCTQKLWIR